MTNVSSLNDRANIAPQNVAARNNIAIGRTARTAMGLPPGAIPEKRSVAVISAATPMAPAKYGNVFPAMMSPREAGVTSNSSPRRLRRSESIDEPYAWMTKFIGTI